MRPDDNPKPSPETVSDCKLMCDHIGPEGLNCEEGQPFYDGNLPGTPGEPNQTCAGFCEYQHANGVDQGAQCIAKVESCEAIETARQKCGL